MTKIYNELDMNSKKITSLATPTTDYDASTKKYVDDNVGLTATGGWIEAGETWTYASSDDPTYTFTISGDLTSKYSDGMRLKLTDSGTQYFIVTDVTYGAPNTTMTIYGGTDYDLSGGAITNPYYSMEKVPVGFTLDPTKWQVRVTDSTDRQQSSPTGGTWYNLGSISIDIPIGIWDVDYQVIGRAVHGSAIAADFSITLSTANNSESDSDLTTFMGARGFDSGAAFAPYVQGTVYKSKTLDLSSKDTYYLNTKSTLSLDSIHNLNATIPAIIRARCAYL